MNVFYETLSGVLEEIRSEGMEREYVILPEDLKEAEAELKTERKKFEALLENLQGKKKEILNIILTNNLKNSRQTVLIFIYFMLLQKMTGIKFVNLESWIFLMTV